MPDFFKKPLDLSVFSTIAEQTGTCILHSGGKNSADEPWTICGWNPQKKFSDLKTATDLFLDKNTPPRFLIGYLAHPNIGLKNIIPDERFYEFESPLFFNQKTGQRFTADPKQWEAVLAGKPKPSSYRTFGNLEQSVDKKTHAQKINQIKDLLMAGEVYQINFAIRFRKQFSGDPYALFLRLAEVNPVDFQAYLNCGNFQVISSSPERFFKVDGGKIITQPIKGTASKSGGKKTLDDLISSEKERAELDMITDLERNDVGKICDYGTLKINKEREILELENLWHTYSEVEGKLKSNIAPHQIIEAMFPGGSITGCPKKRAMRYISELEGIPRNVYTGSIGYVSNYDFQHPESPQSPSLKMDFNIAIRTILIKDGWLELWAGGGIVADSNPEKEYAECLLKAERFFDII